jgi:hypothetical protein
VRFKYLLWHGFSERVCQILSYGNFATTTSPRDTISLIR